MKAPKVNGAGLPKLKTGDTPMLPHLIETSEIRKQMSGIAAPCHTELTPNLPQAPVSEANKQGEADEDFLSMTQERGAEKLDHNARLYFELDPQGKGQNLHSFYTSYQDYLDEYNLIDVSLSAIPSFLSSQIYISAQTF